MFFTSASCCVDCKIAKERHTVDIIKVVNLYTLLNVASDPILSIVYERYPETCGSSEGG